MTIALRTAGPADEPFLWAMLFEASHVAEEGFTGPDQLRGVPGLALYVDGWGRPGDRGVVGAAPMAGEQGDGAPAGGAWIRLLTGDGAGYGHVDDTVPELAIGVAPAARGAGLGTALLVRLLEDARAHHDAVSLSVRADNPARRLYERLGFADVPGSEVTNRAGSTSLTMLARLH
jgi:GNAT superfamily N-acetyltransferase